MYGKIVSFSLFVLVCCSSGLRCLKVSSATLKLMHTEIALEEPKPS